MRLIRLPLSQVTPNPRNARQHSAKDLGQLALILKTVGQIKPIVVRGPENLIVAGNGTFEALRMVNADSVLAVRADELTEAEADAYGIADNRTAALSEWDYGLAAAQVRDLDKALLDMVGFSDQQLAALDDWKPAEVSDEEIDTTGKGKKGDSSLRYYKATPEQGAVIQAAIDAAAQPTPGAAMAYFCKVYVEQDQ